MHDRIKTISQNGEVPPTSNRVGTNSSMKSGARNSSKAPTSNLDLPIDLETADKKLEGDLSRIQEMQHERSPSFSVNSVSPKMAAVLNPVLANPSAFYDYKQKPTPRQIMHGNKLRIFHKMR